MMETSGSRIEATASWQADPAMDRLLRGAFLSRPESEPAGNLAAVARMRAAGGAGAKRWLRQLAWNGPTLAAAIALYFILGHYLGRLIVVSSTNAGQSWWRETTKTLSADAGTTGWITLVALLILPCVLLLLATVLPTDWAGGSPECGL